MPNNTINFTLTIYFTMDLFHEESYSPEDIITLNFSIKVRPCVIGELYKDD